MQFYILYFKIFIYCVYWKSREIQNEADEICHPLVYFPSTYTNVAESPQSRWDFHLGSKGPGTWVSTSDSVHISRKLETGLEHKQSDPTCGYSKWLLAEYLLLVYFKIYILWLCRMAILLEILFVCTKLITLKLIEEVSQILSFLEFICF